jgi:hypothetical protein
MGHSGTALCNIFLKIISFLLDLNTAMPYIGRDKTKKPNQEYKMITVKNTNGRIYEIKECVIGSEKMIAWANRIKAEKLPGTFFKVPADHKQYDQVLKLTDKANEIIDAKWWIDNCANGGLVTSQLILKAMRG